MEGGWGLVDEKTDDREVNVRACVRQTKHMNDKNGQIDTPSLQNKTPKNKPERYIQRGLSYKIVMEHRIMRRNEESC